MLMLSWRQRRTVCRQTQGSCLKTMAWWDATQPEAMTCQSMQKFTAQVLFAFFGHQLDEQMSYPLQSILEVKYWSDTRKSIRRFARANSWYAWLWPWNCCISHWRQRLEHDWGQILCLLQDVFRTQRKWQWVTRSNLQRLRCCVCHFHHEQALRAPYRVRHFLAKVLKKVRHYRVDVVAGDATAAAYRYQQRQEYQDLCNLWVAVMLREMLREVNMNRPFQSRLHCDYSTNNHHSQLHSTEYPDCCFMAYSPMEKTAWTQNCEKTHEQHVWAYTEWTKGASWGQLLSWGYWSLADGGGWEELSRSREPWQCNGCTTRLWEKNVIHTMAGHKWHLTWISCRITGRCRNWEHVGSHWRKATNRQIRGRNLKFFLWMIFSGKVEPKWNNGCPRQTYKKAFPSWFRRMEWRALNKTKNSLDHGFSIRHQALWLAKKRLMKNWRRSQ